MTPAVGQIKSVRLPRATHVMPSGCSGDEGWRENFIVETVVREVYVLGSAQTLVHLAWISEQAGDKPNARRVVN